MSLWLLLSRLSSAFVFFQFMSSKEGFLKSVASFDDWKTVLEAIVHDIAGTVDTCKNSRLSKIRHLFRGGFQITRTAVLISWEPDEAEHRDRASY